MLAEGTLPTLRSFMARFPNDQAFLDAHDHPFLLLVPADDRPPADDAGPTEVHSTLWFNPGIQEWQLHVLESLVVPVHKRTGANAFSTMITVGRAPNNDLILSYAGISKFQAYFTNPGSGWQLWDGKSRNGTSVQGQLVGAGASVPLRSRDLIHFGEHEARFLNLEDMHELMQDLWEMTRPR